MLFPLYIEIVTLVWTFHIPVPLNEGYGLEAKWGLEWVFISLLVYSGVLSRRAKNLKGISIKAFP